MNMCACASASYGGPVSMSFMTSSGSGVKESGHTRVITICSHPVSLLLWVIPSHSPPDGLLLGLLWVTICKAVYVCQL